MSVRAPHLLANYKVKDARLWKNWPRKKNITLKRTSTQRSDSNGSESSSPLDKRVRNTKYKENEDEVQEVFEEAFEVSPAQELEITNKMSEKLDEIY